MNNWSKYSEGMLIEWEFSYSPDDMLQFEKLIGDHNPIHSDNDFAQSKGYNSPIVYGCLLAGQISRLIGQEMPDQNAMLISLKIDFIKPSFIGEVLNFKAELISKSDSTHMLLFKCFIFREQTKLCRGLIEAVWRA